MTELTIRDWMVIVGVLLILAVILDAVRRMRSERALRGRAGATVEAEESGSDDELLWPRELPNGGARVVQRSDLARAMAEEADPDDAPAAVAAAEQRPAPQSLEDPVELVDGFSAIEAQDEPVARESESDRGSRRGGRRRSAVAPRENRAAPPEDAAPETLDWLDRLEQEDAPPAEEKPAPGRLPRGIEPEVFMLNVVARSPDGFRGEDILHILLACDLRFGDMNFFHRHEFAAGRGPIQFSVANMMQPGVFDIDHMAELATPGLVFFLTLPGPEDMMKAFDYMLETAQAVARNLDGDVLDESRSAITRQTTEHSRQRIRELERRMLARTSSA